MPQVTLDQARAAKASAMKLFERLGMNVAVGITRVGDNYAVKVNVGEPPPADVKIPTEVDGVPIKFEVTGTIRPR